MKKVCCATYEALEAKVVEVESTLTKGLPSFSIVGMVSTSINEAKERVKSALLCNNFTFPPKRITINLAPSDLKKEGSHFDLSIALLIALDDAECELDGWFVFGELSLDGSLRENNQLYALMLSLAKERSIQRAIVPFESLDKLANIPSIELYGAKTLDDVVQFFKNSTPLHKVEAQTISEPSLQIDGKHYFYHTRYELDFLDVRGQEIAKRAALIAAAGLHNLLLEGSPGCGKSMIASRIRYILPPVSSSELLEIAKLETLDLKEPSFYALRPFRSPHHTSTSASIFGGGSHKARIGEVGLAHLGVLFFDELPHFGKGVLEALREPLQDNRIRISRVNAKVEYPSEFLFIGAMNPCPCGNLLSDKLECRCNDLELNRYKNRLSDPFLDRIDLYVKMQSVSADDKSSLSSKEMHAKTLEAFAYQKARSQKRANAKLSDEEIERFCMLEPEAEDMLRLATERFVLSFRSINNLKKIARTIADLSSSKMIAKEHMLEALSYRRR